MCQETRQSCIYLQCMLEMGHTPALRVHVNREVLEDVHVAAVRDAGHAGTVPLCPDELDCLGADVHH